MSEFTTEWFKVDPDGKGVLKIDGDIDMAAGPVLRKAMLEQEEQGDVVLDLSGVSFIDSSGLRTLLDAARRAEEREGTLTLRKAGPEVRRLLEITGTTSKFTMEQPRD